MLQNDDTFLNLILKILITLQPNTKLDRENADMVSKSFSVNDRGSAISREDKKSFGVRMIVHYFTIEAGKVASTGKRNCNEFGVKFL